MLQCLDKTSIQGFTFMKDVDSTYLFLVLHFVLNTFKNYRVSVQIGLTSY